MVIKIRNKNKENINDFLKNNKGILFYSFKKIYSDKSSIDIEIEDDDSEELIDYIESYGFNCETEDLENKEIKPFKMPKYRA